MMTSVSTRLALVEGASGIKASGTKLIYITSTGGQVLTRQDANACL
jgi:hypothetical protein